MFLWLDVLGYNKEISKVEDIGRIVRKAHYESNDFCLCSDCVDYFDKAAEDDLIEWYRLINAKKCLMGNIILKGIVGEQEKKSDYEIEIEEGGCFRRTWKLWLLFQMKELCQDAIQNMMIMILELNHNIMSGYRKLVTV